MEDSTNPRHGTASDDLPCEEERARAEAAAERARFLAEASRMLASALGYEASLRRVVRLAVPRLADWCLVYTVEDHGKVRRLEGAHADPDKEAQLEEMLRRFPFEHSVQHHPVGEVLSTGQLRLLPDVSDADLRAIAQSEEHLEMLRSLGIGSVLAVPLVARGTILGALVLVNTGSGRSFGSEDVELAEELAGRAAVAMDNARLYEAALVANQAKSDFLAVISHELRTPLNAILGFADLLEMGIGGELSDKQEHHVQRISTSARNLLQIINQILDFSHAESAGERVRLESVDLGALVRDATENMRELAQERGLELVVGVPAAPVDAQVDPDKVRQIVLNLLSNALKFSETGTVAVELRAGPEQVHIEVHDTGIGIAPEHLERIFDPFWQAERATTRRSGGTGLGLSVARKLARLLGGEVTVDSTLGQGSRFTVSLPRAAGG